MEFQTFTHQKVLWVSHENEQDCGPIVSVMYTELLLHHREVIQV